MSRSNDDEWGRLRSLEEGRKLQLRIQEITRTFRGDGVELKPDGITPLYPNKQFRNVKPRPTLAQEIASEVVKQLEPLLRELHIEGISTINEIL